MKKFSDDKYAAIIYIQLNLYKVNLYKTKKCIKIQYFNLRTTQPMA